MAGAAQTPSRLTLVVGPEEVLAERALGETIRGIRSLDPGVERVEVEASADDAAYIVGDALSPNLFGDPVVVIVRGIDSCTDELDALLRATASEPIEHAWLLLVHPGGVKGKNLLDFLKKSGAARIDCPALKRGRDTLDYLAKEVSARRRRISQPALQTLYDAVGHDLRLLTAAVAQLCSDIEHDPIDVDDVAAFFTGVADVSGYQIADAVWERRAVDALRSLRWSMGSDSTVATVAALAGAVRAIVRVAGVGPGASEQAVAAEAGVPPWKVRLLRRQWSMWSADQRSLAAAIVALADADADSKGGLVEGQSLDAEQKLRALERLVLQTAARAG